MTVCEDVPVEKCQLVTRTVCEGEDLKPQGSSTNCNKVVKLTNCRIDENCCKKVERTVCTTSDGAEECRKCGYECSQCLDEIPFLDQLTKVDLRSADSIPFVPLRRIPKQKRRF